MIQMITGVYGGKNGMKRASDGPFSLSPEEEARLVARKVAKYVNNNVPVADELPQQEEDTAPSIETMTMAELRTLGKEHGLTFRVGMSKAVMIEAIMAKLEEEEQEDDSDGNPAEMEHPDEKNPEDEDPDVEDPDEDAPTFDPTQAVQ